MNDKESQFLIDFISSKYLSASERKKAVELAFKEVGEDGAKGSENRELRAYLHSQAKGEEKKEQLENKYQKQPNPKDVANFMSLFNQRDGLKYLTHDFDESADFDIDKFLISAKKVFDKETRKLNIPQSLWRIVKQFAFESKQTEWYSITDDYSTNFKVSKGWATKELRDWSKENRLHPIRNDKYKRMINDFKRITRIEPPNLEKIIDASLSVVFGEQMSDFEINKVALLKADFYSHVRDLKIAFETIFEEIKEQSVSAEKKKLTIEYERSVSNDGFYLRKILITHHNSSPVKELGLILKEWQEKGNMGKIKEKLNGFCHWSVETTIDDAPSRINILREEGIEEYEKIVSDPRGFKHILTFYYK